MHTSRYMMLVAGAAMLFASPALAGPGSPTAATAQANTKAQIVEPLTLTKKGDLNFGTIVKTSSLSATTPVTLNLNNAGTLGGCTAGSGLLCSGATTASSFQAAGTAGQLVYVYTNPTETMASGSNNLVFTPNLAGPVTLDASTGLVNFGVGGSIDVAKGTPPGVYAGTMDVTVDYN